MVAPAPRRAGRSTLKRVHWTLFRARLTLRREYLDQDETQRVGCVISRTFHCSTLPSGQLSR